jgi:3-hydroxyisobutyrate dehydrogenase
MFYVVDMTTSSPELAVRIHGEASQRGYRGTDAPVSGGDLGAREAGFPSWSVVTRILSVHSPALPGHGQEHRLPGEGRERSAHKDGEPDRHRLSEDGVCEALAYAEKAGLDPRNVLASIESGAAGSWTLSKLGPRMLSGDFEPGFYVKHFIKDMRIALASAEELHLDAPGLRTSLGLYERLAGEGGENEGTQALFKLYRR